MKKSDGEIHEKTASWGILQSEWLRKCGRLLLLLLYRFVIGWAFFQLLAMIVAGIFLLGVLLFHPIIFVQTIAITEKLNHASLTKRTKYRIGYHASLDLWHILKLCLWHYGIIAGFIFMAECTLSKSIRQVQRLSKKFGAQDFSSRP
ncbi:Putative membrane protein [Salmonella enterica subsp. enterica serovar Gaminara str. A4-567]|nr:Putative membrane protein [Salmonella enterica subsp. enterica serovar Gaminara str. A4-567]